MESSRPWLTWMKHAITAALLLLAAAGALGMLLRDRIALLAGLTYLPLLPPAALLLTWDLALRGRALRRPRFIVSLAALGGIAWAIVPMLGRGGDAGDGAIRILQWNVQWGGPARSGTMDAIAQHARQADIVILSEAPRGEAIPRLAQQLGFTCVRATSEPGGGHWYHLAVLSRWPLSDSPAQKLDGGVAWPVRISTPRGSLRLLVVDGLSSPTRDRRPMLRDLDCVMQREEDAGHAIDVLAGDFNAPWRSAGFDVLRQRGYQLAAGRCGGWRGTWPAPLPLYDLDHVLLAPRFKRFDCQLLTQPTIDHRGEVVRVMSEE